MSNIPETQLTGQAEFLELDRITELDGIRGLALALCLWTHCFLVNPTSIVARLANSIGGSGFIAMDSFFVLSGFLITGILIRTRSSPHRVRNFYVRRALRVFPAYYFVLIFIFFVYPLFYKPLRDANVENEAVYFFLYVQNFWHTWNESASGWPGLDHLWSMAVEEQYYLLWPLVVWHTPPLKLARLCAVIFVVAVTFKLALLAAGANMYQLYLPTYCRIEGLIAGSGLAALWQTHNVRRTPTWLKAAGMIATICLLFLIFRKSGAKVNNPKDMVAHVITATVAFSWLIFAAATAPPTTLVRRFFRNRLLRFLGRYSYGIYLLHYVVYWQIKYFVLDALGSTTNASNTAAVIAGIAIVSVTIPLAMLMHRFIETPALQLKRFFMSSAAAAQSAVTVFPTAHTGDKTASSTPNSNIPS